MENNYTEFVPCQLCGNTDNTPYHHELKVVADKRVRLGLNNCSHCGLNYISPRLSEYSLKALYDNSYLDNTVSGSYNTDASVSSQEYSTFCKYIEEYLPHGGHVLDVGCGVGNLLSKLNNVCGIKAEGIEFSKYAAEEAKGRGLDVHHGTLSDFVNDGKTYDCVVLLYVLEHLPNASEIIKMAHQILKPNGLLLLAVPNYHYLRLAYDNFFARSLFKTSLHPEEHLQNFTPKTLKMLISGNGFEIAKIACAKPLKTKGATTNLIKNIFNLPLMLLSQIGIHVGGIHLICRKPK